MKACKDCKHSVRVSFHHIECRRRAKFVTVTDCTGESKRELTNTVSCCYERGYSPFIFWKCGKNARFFEPKQTQR